MINLDYSWIDFSCPVCNYSNEIQLIDAKLERVVYCHNCKQDIKLIDENASTYSGVSQINEAMNSLEKTLQNLFK